MRDTSKTRTEGSVGSLGWPKMFEAEQKKNIFFKYDFVNIGYQALARFVN